MLFGYGGYLKLGTFRAMCREGASLAMPRTLDIPYPISVQRFGQLNYADGFRFPVIQAPLIPMDMGTDDATIPSWFSAANLNAWFVTRGSGPAYDLAEISSDIQFSDNGVAGGTGWGTYKIIHAKGAGFSLNVNQGSPIGFMARFAGTDRKTGSITPPTSGLPGAPLQAGRVALGGSFANVGVIGFTLDFDTGLTPNMVLNGTNRPTEHNADIPTATFTIRCYTDNTFDPPGFASSDSGDPAYTEITDGTITIIRRAAVGMVTAKTMTIAMNRAILVDPDDRRQFRGRIVRTFRYNLLATTTDYPITITEA